MAIKVNGTTVIDDSRNLSNIAGGLKTINSTSIIGSGNISAGASTTYGAVGTYVFAFIPYNGTTINPGSTHSASTLQYYEVSGQYARGIKEEIGGSSNYSTGLSGTWRMMNGKIYHYSNGDRYGAIFVRIS